MTAQRWWSPDALRRIRRGIEVGRYHAGFPFGQRYAEILAASSTRELTLYEQGLAAGFESVRKQAQPTD